MIYLFSCELYAEYFRYDGGQHYYVRKLGIAKELVTDLLRKPVRTVLDLTATKLGSLNSWFITLH